MRRGEAVALMWRDVDLETGTISLDENKTDHARMWKLAPGDSEALAAWRKFREEPDDGPPVELDPTELVFTDEHGRPLQADHLADMVRRHLLLAA